MRCVIVSLCAKNKYYVFCSALVHKRCRPWRDTRVRAAWRSECVACTCTRATSHRVDRGSMRWGPWVSTSILFFLGVLILFTEAFHGRRRSDNRIYELNIMMFSLHSAARRVMYETGSQVSTDFGGRIAKMQDGVDLWNRACCRLLEFIFCMRMSNLFVFVHCVDAERVSSSGGAE